MPIADDFNSLPDNTPLSNDANWEIWAASGAGVPTTDQHDDHSDGSQVVDQSNVGDGYCIYQTEVGSDDHFVELDVFVDVDPSNDNFAGPIARGSQPVFGVGTDGYAAWAYCLGLGGGQSSLAVGIFRIDADVPTELVNTGNIHATYDAGLMHRLRIEVAGDEITALLDGDQLLQATDPIYTTGQWCGFRLFREVASTFSQPFVDNFDGDTLGSTSVIIERTGQLAGVGTLDATGDVEGTVDRSGNIAGTATLTGVGTRILERSGLVEADSTLTADGEIVGVVERAGSMAGIATFVADGQVIAEPTERFNMELVALSPRFRPHSASEPLFRVRVALAPEFVDREAGEPAFRERSSDTVFAAREAEPPTFLTGEQNG